MQEDREELNNEFWTRDQFEDFLKRNHGKRVDLDPDNFPQEIDGGRVGIITDELNDATSLDGHSCVDKLI